jgi:hypothetical protein
MIPARLWRNGGWWCWFPEERFVLVASLCIFLLWVFPVSLHAQTECPETRTGAFAGFFENDTKWLTRLGQSDDNYTTGVRAVVPLASDGSAQGPPSWHWPLRPLTGLFEKLRSECYLRNLTVYGLSIYTPSKTESFDPIPSDRPYAGWMYTSYSLDAFRKDFKTQRTLEVAVGIVGPGSAAGRIQNKIHERFRKPLVNGWPHQLPNEPGVVVSYIERRRVASLPKQLGDIIVHAGGTGGNVFIHGNSGITARVGHRAAGLAVPDRPMVVEAPEIFEPPFELQPPRRDPVLIGLLKRLFLPLHQIYLFGRLDGRAVGWNIFIDESVFRKKRHTIHTEHILVDMEAGIVLRAGPFHITYRTVGRSREFEELQINPKRHWCPRSWECFGSLQMTIDFRELMKRGGVAAPSR